MFTTGTPPNVSAIAPLPMRQIDALAERGGGAVPRPVKVLLPLPLRGALDYLPPEAGARRFRASSCG